MKKKIIGLALVAALALSGCGNNSKMESIDAGMAAIEQNSYEEALEQFEAAIAKGNNIMLAYRGEGIAYIGLGDYPNAIASFSRALNEKAANKKNVTKDILYYKASAQYKNQEYLEAIQTYGEIIAIAEEADAYYLRATVYLANQQYEEASADFEKSVSLDEEDTNLYFDIYERYAEVNRTDEGSGYLEKLLALQSEDAVESYDKGRIYYYLGNYEKAEAQLSAVIEQGNTEAIFLLGKVYLALEDAQSAQTMYTKYLSEVSETTTAYNGLALSQILAGNYDGAIDSITKGLSLTDTTDIQSLKFNEIVIYEKKLDFETAKAKAAEYAAVYPSDSAGQKEYEFLQTR